MLCLSFELGLGLLGLAHPSTEASMSPSKILTIESNFLTLHTVAGR